MDDCPVQPYIPIYLVVGGAMSTCMVLICMTQIVCRATDNEHFSGFLLALCYCCKGVIGGFISIWFLVGECITCLCVLAYVFSVRM